MKPAERGLSIRNLSLPLPLLLCEGLRVLSHIEREYPVRAMILWMFVHSVLASLFFLDGKYELKRSNG